MSNSINITGARLSLELASAFGPRVTGLTPVGGPNLFADLGGFGVELPDGGRFVFRGGHRLWLAPETLDVTYEPDNDPVRTEVREQAAGAFARVGNVDKGIELAIDGDVIQVDHTLTNRSDDGLEVALWAITQLIPGGRALIPLHDQRADPAGFQAQNHVVGWPYTDWGALEAFSDADVLIVDGRRETPTKIGVELTRGWLAYQVDGWLFAKYAEYRASSLDRGATGQVYACADFVELETLAPLTMIVPGDTVRHREYWRVWRDPGSVTEVVHIVEAGIPR